MVSKYLTRTRDTSKRPSLITGVFKELQTENDRSVAIVAAGLVDDGIARLIEHHFVKLEDSDIGALFHGMGPIASLYSRILVGFSMGLFGPETRKDLGVMGQIRNEFAHNPEKIDFQSETINALCQKLTYPRRYSQKAQKKYQELKEIIETHSPSLSSLDMKVCDPFPTDNRTTYIMMTAEYCQGLFMSLAVPPSHVRRAQAMIRD